MKTLLGMCAAAAMTAALALPAPAVAAEKRADGVRNTEQLEVSDQRRKYRNHYRHRHVHRYYAPRYGYYRPYRPYYYDAPYYAYAPRYYQRPGVSVGVGPFGFGFGF